jgi:hypothetical protein
MQLITEALHIKLGIRKVRRDKEKCLFKYFPTLSALGVISACTGEDVQDQRTALPDGKSRFVGNEFFQFGKCQGEFVAVCKGNICVERKYRFL